MQDLSNRARVIHVGKFLFKIKKPSWFPGTALKFIGLILSDLNSAKYLYCKPLFSFLKVLTDIQLIVFDELLIEEGIFLIKFIQFALSNFLEHFFGFT
jgi:hypothetical protein